MASIVAEDPEAPALSDDRPVNEYFLVRRFRQRSFRKTLEHRVLNRSEYF
jgi:hypothetical protein